MVNIYICNYYLETLRNSVILVSVRLLGSKCVFLRWSFNSFLVINWPCYLYSFQLQIWYCNVTVLYCRHGPRDFVSVHLARCSTYLLHRCCHVLSRQISTICFQVSLSSARHLHQTPGRLCKWFFFLSTGGNP